MEILDADRLRAAAEIDRRYHVGKLTAAAFNDPARLWEEHERVRGALLVDAGTDAVPTTDLMAVGAAMWRQALAKGVIPPKGEAH